jgi:MoaA/NifB/PqqE/SkfB family radical SAM enzyme
MQLGGNSLKLSMLAKLAVKHIQNAVSESVYLQTGQDTTQPVAFYGSVNERCNVKCRFCDYWRLGHYETELTLQQWQAALLSIKAFVGTYSINFSGGEPLLKPGFIDLMNFCHRQGIHSGVTTNGYFLTAETVPQIVAAHPFNLNISVDAPTAKLHDYLRGFPGLFTRLSQGITLLLQEQEAQGVYFPLIIKPTVNALNLSLLPDLVVWAQQMGATAVNFQPLDRLTPETYDELWVEAGQLAELEAVIERLLHMKQQGAPILNSEQSLKLWLSHFQEVKALPEGMPCRVGLRNYFIRANGDVKLCATPHYPAVGNVKDQSAQEIWYGEKAQAVRRQTVSCDRLCLFTSLSHKTLKDKVEMGLKLVR